MRLATKLRVKFGDTDCTGRVYFPVYVRWIDDGITEMLRERGMTYNPVGRLALDGNLLDVTFVIGEYSCRIERPSQFDDEVLLEVRVKELRQKVVVFEGVLKRPEDGERLAVGTVTYVCVNTRDSRSAEIPEKIRSLLMA